MGKSSDKVSTLHNLARDQSKEAKDQLLLTDKINQRVDNTEQKMRKLDGKLDQFVANTSDCKVWMYIVLQIVILVTFIIIS